VERLEDLKVPPGNHLEALSGDRKGQYSVRINDQFRICFRWEADGAYDVEIVDYHDKEGAKPDAYPKTYKGMECPAPPRSSR
jgi:hypothetical protein